MDYTPSVKGKKRLVLAGASILAAAGLMTAAAFTDFANLNLGAAGDDAGIGGGDSRFNIQVVGTDELTDLPVPGTWQEANTSEGVTIAIPGANTITPGDTLTVEIPFRNESPALGASIDFALQDQPGKTSDEFYASQLRYTIQLGDEVLLEEATMEQANLHLGTYAANTEDKLTVSIHLLDQGDPAKNNALQGKIAYVQAHFGAESVKP